MQNLHKGGGDGDVIAAPGDRGMAGGGSENLANVIREALNAHFRAMCRLIDCWKTPADIRAGLKELTSLVQPPIDRIWCEELHRWGEAFDAQVAGCPDTELVGLHRKTLKQLQENIVFLRQKAAKQSRA